METDRHIATQKGFFSQLSAKAAFFFGAMVATTAISIIALLVVLLIVVRGEKITATTATTNTANADDAGDALVVADIPFRAIGKDEVIRGEKNAKATVIIYSDLECPFCKTGYVTYKQLLENNKGKINLVFRQFPIASLHSQAQKEAEAVECAGDQGKFWEMIDLIFERTPSNNGLKLADLPSYAKELGINVDSFNSCLSSEKFKEKVQQDLSDATAVGARGTPHTVVVTQKGKGVAVSGAVTLAIFQQAVDLALKN